MADFSTTKLSSKGQVVIPEPIRAALNLEEGTQFMVFHTSDSVIFKTLEPPKLEDLSRIMAEAQARFAKVKVPKSAVKETIASVRKAKKTKKAA